MPTLRTAPEDVRSISNLPAGSQQTIFLPMLANHRRYLLFLYRSESWAQYQRFYEIYGRGGWKDYTGEKAFLPISKAIGRAVSQTAEWFRKRSDHA